MIKSRSIPCGQCGAMLEVSAATDGHLRCTYCGTEVLIERPAPAPTPPPAPEPPPAPPPPHATTSSSPTGCLVTSFVFVAIASGVGYLVTTKLASAPISTTTVTITNSSTVTSTSTSTTSIAAPSAPRYWTGGGCLVDADGDAFGDLYFLATGSDSQFRPTLLSGADGAVLWEGEPIANVMPLFCAVSPSGASRVVHQRPDFTLVIVDPRHRESAVTAALTDKLQSAAVGEGCAALATIDGKRTELLLSAGMPAPCPGSAPVSFTPMHDRVALQTGVRTISLDKRTITVSKRPQGTPLITVSATAKTGAAIFNVELSLQALAFDFAVARPSDDTVAIVGNSHPDNKGVVVGVDVTTGRVRYTTPVPSRGAVAIPLLSTNGFDASGGRLYLLAAGNVHVFDGATGALIWSMN